MLLCEVLGQVWGARQAPRLAGHRLLIVEPFAVGDDGSLRRSRRRLVVVDDLGAGPGEMVLIAHGSRCRDLTSGPEVPTKEVVVAIVDNADLGACR